MQIIYKQRRYQESFGSLTEIEICAPIFFISALLRGCRHACDPHQNQHLQGFRIYSHNFQLKVVVLTVTIEDLQFTVAVSKLGKTASANLKLLQLQILKLQKLHPRFCKSHVFIHPGEES